MEKKELKDLDLLDRFLFAEAIEDPETMELILEIILGREVILKHLPQAEKEQRCFLWSKQVKLDVWAKDVDDVVYDTEVQKKNTKDLPKRSRLYSSMIDSKLLPVGMTSYKPLNDVYVIMITPFDLFGKGLYRYTFNMRCQEVPDIELEDGATRIFLNTRGTNPNGVSHELIELLRYFEHSTDETASRAGSERIARLHEKVSHIKASEEIGVKFMNAWEEKLLDRQEGYDEGLEAGKQEGLRIGEEKGRKEGMEAGEKKGLRVGEERGLKTGRKKERQEIAAKMKARGMSLEEIAEITGMEASEIENS